MWTILRSENSRKLNAQSAAKYNEYAWHDVDSCVRQTKQFMTVMCVIYLFIDTLPFPWISSLPITDHGPTRRMLQSFKFMTHFNLVYIAFELLESSREKFQLTHYFLPKNILPMIHDPLKISEKNTCFVSCYLLPNIFSWYSCAYNTIINLASCIHCSLKSERIMLIYFI